MSDQVPKHNKSAESANHFYQEQLPSNSIASARSGQAGEEKNSQLELVDDDVGYQVSGTITTKNNQELYRPVLCLKNLLKLLCLIGIGLLIVIVFFSLNSPEPENKFEQKQKAEIVIKEDKITQAQIDNKTKPLTIQQTNSSTLNGQEIHPNSSASSVTTTDITTDPSDAFNIQINSFPSFLIYGEEISNFGIHKDIQIGSMYDYLNITSSPQFKLFKENWNRSIESYIYEFQFNPILNQTIPLLNFTNFQDPNQIQKYLKTLNQWNLRQNYGSDLALYFGTHLLWNPNDTKLQQAELHYFQKKFQISQYPNELPICLFSTGYKIATRERHINFIQSIERQNYSNYHVVAVDDNSPDESAEKIYKYLNGTNNRIKNKIKIVRNLKNLGATLSTYYWSRQLCNPKDIIVHVDMDDMLIGRQVFKVLNAIYHDPNIWYAYTRYIIQYSPSQMPNAGKSRPINFKVKDYRHLLDWKTSAMRTLRYEVMKNVPVQHVVEYHYDQESKKLKPRFYDTDADRFLIYSQLQLCGEGRIRYISDPFYYYNTSYNLAGKCNMRHEHFDEYKSRVKTGVKPMKSLEDQKIEFYALSGYNIPKNVTDNLKDRYNKYLDCLKAP